ncbi:uncharacterized protein LDX57_006675 [Aspergillus melleus]|uniref:uncharacterized protein n=1 Tax=Aspergillus melleus TaxID=138277 RepID=UPI001E8D7C85|nr:uncharacterized protein LDX57_006675 [Aspergillus melleus]KAH8429004.1 hypothetical protein LDX57_006675 [Aspergillus melleus]
MSGSRNETMENLAITLRNERIADAEEDPFHLSNEMEDLSLDDAPPAHTEHEGPQSTNLSPVDYAEGSGEWRELDILPQYTPEELERIMQDVYNEYMGDSMHDSDQQEGDGEHRFDEIELIPGYAAVNEYLDTLPDPAVFEVDGNFSQAQNGNTGSEMPNSLPDPAVFDVNDSSPQALNENTRSETVEDESDQLPEPTPPVTHTESSGTDQVDDANGSNSASGPANGQPSGQVPSGNTPVDEPAHHETGSIPELVVSDYDNDHPLASRQPDHSDLPNGHHIIDLDCSTEVLSEADSLPELERVRGNRTRPSGTHTNRNGVECDIETSDPLVNEIESFAALVTTDSHGVVNSEDRERDTYQSEDPVSLSEALVNDTITIPHLTNSTRLITLEEVPEDEEPLDPFHPQNEASTIQGPVDMRRYMLPHWSWDSEAMPGYEVFVDSLSPDEFDVTNDREDSQRGRFGYQGDEDDIPWDAQPLLYFDLPIRPRDGTPRTPLSPISNVFEDLAVALDDGEVIDYAALPEGNISEHEAQAAGMTTEWRLPADEVVTVAGW